MRVSRECEADDCARRPEAVAARSAFRERVASHLSAARFPIRNGEEMRQAFGPTADAKMGAVRLGAEELVGLLVPRDYVFTNPYQVADLLVQRAVASYGAPAVPRRREPEASLPWVPEASPPVERAYGIRSGTA